MLKIKSKALRCAKELTTNENTYSKNIKKHLEKKKTKKKIKINYGIYKYTKEQKEFHKDIMKVLKMKKHKKIPADDCMVVFGRCYSIYCMSQLKEERKIKVKK